MDGILRSNLTNPRTDHKDDRQPDDRLTYVERELAGLRQRLDDLLAFIKQDDMAPLTPIVWPYRGNHREEQS